MGKKKIISRDTLSDLYTSGMSQRAIATELGCSVDLVRSEMTRHHIIPRANTAATTAVKPAYDEFYDLYVTQSWSIDKLRQHYNASNASVAMWITEFNIPKRDRHENNKLNLPACDIQSVIDETPNITMVTLSDKFNTTKETMIKYMHDYNIEKEHTSTKIMYEHDELYDLYITQKKTLKEVGAILGTSDTHIMKELERHQIPTRPRGGSCNGSPSQGEMEVLAYIQSLDLECIQSDMSVIGNRELDIVIPSKKVAIEYNGLYWHSTKCGKDIQYHINKTNKTNSAGYRLIHIFEDEWKNKKDIVKAKIRSILGKNTNRIYARKCSISIISTEKRRSFLDQNHIQGDGAGSVNLCLTYNEQVVAVMNFLDMKNNKYKLNRFASSIQVVGGFSKLLKYFINMYDPSYIETFADLRWSSQNSNVYDTNGFTHVYNSEPNYFYSKCFTMRHTRQQYMKHRLEAKLDIYDAKLTEVQNMNNNGYYQIFDCGNMKFVWERKT